MQRIITGTLGLLILIPVCILSHTFFFSLILSFFALIASFEMLSCAGVHKQKCFLFPAFFFSLLPLITDVLSVRFFSFDPYRVIFVFSCLYFLTMQLISVFAENRIYSEKLYSTIALILYVVIAFTAIGQIRYFDSGNQEGKYIYLLIFLGAWISDTFAYFTGKALGKHALCPKISPKKTVEGSIGGVLANMIGFAGYALILQSFFDVHANVFFFAVLGALFSVVGQFGDLFASCIKRHYGIKDYGKLFPGHGGVMDRFDSTLAIAISMLLIHAAFGSTYLMV